MRLYRRELFVKHHLHFPSGMIYEDVIFSIDFWGCNPSYKMLSYTGYNYLASVTVGSIPYEEADNSAGGKTVTIA
jgi:hypothetical protein